MPSNTANPFGNKTLSSALSAFAATPDDQGLAYKVESAYWSTVTDSVAAVIRDGSTIEAFLNKTAAAVNFGLFPETVAEIDRVTHEITALPESPAFLKVNLVTDYLKDILHTITGGDRKQLVRNEIKLARHQSKRLESEITQVRKNRREALSETVAASELPESSAAKQGKALEEIDKLLLKSVEVKKSITQGVFISVDERREHVKREKEIEASRAKVESFLNGLKDREGAKKIKDLSKQILETIGRRADVQNSIVKLTNDERQLEHEQGKLSPLEIENKVRDEITYLRDLAKLCAKRLRIQSRPIIRETDVFFTIRKLHSCIDRIMEFDPNILRNDRVNLFGHPSVLLVPGVGKSLYDWKHNQIVVPILAFQNNQLASFATGAIEYRLDVDDDKKLLYSYNQLPEHKKTRSLFQLKASLYKDYATWMASEYQGYRVLPSTTKKWFDHEIAPNRNDIYTPPHLRPTAMTTTEFRKLIAEVDKRLEVPESGETQDLWIGSILHFQQGDYKHSVELLTYLTQRTDMPAFAHYNLGIACARDMRKQASIDAFKAFVASNGQSWWSNLAREHARQLQLK